MQPRFIVVEGLEGAGKTSAVARIKTLLEQQGIACITCREPGGTPLAERIRTLVKAVNPQQEQLQPMTELLLMYASRLQLVANRIKPALAKGQWVIADRHDLSSQAYQGGGRGIDAGLISAIKQSVLGDFTPDFTLYLDIEPERGLSRAQQRGSLDRFEQAGLAFLQRTRQRFLQLAQQDANTVIIDARQPLAQVDGAIQQALVARYPELAIA